MALYYYQKYTIYSSVQMIVVKVSKEGILGDMQGYFLPHSTISIVVFTIFG